MTTRYSQLYIDRGPTAADSPRFRKRVGHKLTTIYKLVDFGAEELAQSIQEELGVDVPCQSNYYDFRKFCLSCELRDLLDTITLAFLIFSDRTTHGEEFRTFVQRLFEEENLTYRVDDEGVVHYSPDAEYECNRAATIEALKDRRAVLDAFETGQREMGKNNKTAIRSVFEAVEILSKLMDDRITRLGPKEVEKYLRPIVASQCSGDPVAKDAAGQFLTGLSDWVNAAHLYRHGHGVEEPTDPPLGFAIAMVSTGASYLRWLAEMQNANDG